MSDLGRRLGIPKSTAHNLLRTLESLDFLVQEPADKRYRLGPRIFQLGLLYFHSTQLLVHVLPHLRRLADQTRETVKLAILSDGELLVLVAIESPHQLHTRGDEGRRAPVHCTALGKAILALLSDAEIREIAARRGLARFTARTITSLKRLEREVAQIRASGYAVDREEHEEGVRCLGAGITEWAGHARAAVSVCEPASRLSDERIAALAPLAVDTARAIAASLGQPSGKRLRVDPVWRDRAVAG